MFLPKAKMLLEKDTFGMSLVKSVIKRLELYSTKKQVVIAANILFNTGMNKFKGGYIV